MADVIVRWVALRLDMGREVGVVMGRPLVGLKTHPEETQNVSLEQGKIQDLDLERFSR